MMRQAVWAALLMGLCPAGWAQTSAEPLPGAGDYPDPHCTKPRVTMIKPGAWNNSDAVDSYNSKVRTFNKDAAAYDACMHAYIDNASRDVKIIQDKANADLKQITERANASMKVIQDKIKQAVADAQSVGAAMDQETATLRK